MEQQKKPAFYWFVVVSAIVIGGYYLASIPILARHGTIARDFGWDIATIDNKPIVGSIDPEGPVAGKLSVGDQVISINGDPRVLGIDFNGTRMIAVRVADTYQIQIIRNSRPMTLSLNIRETRSTQNLLRLLVVFLAGFISFIVASITGFSRPERHSAQLFTVTWFSVSFIQLAATLVPLESHLTPWEYTFAYLSFLLSLSPIEVATSYHFYSRFPRGSNPGPFWVFLRKLFYAIFAALTIYFTYLRIIFLPGREAQQNYLFANFAVVSFLERFAEFSMLAAVVAMGVVVYRNYNCGLDLAEKRRIQWVVYGSILGLLPTALFFLVKFGVDTGIWHYSHSALSWLFTASNACLVIIPITIGYAIVKHRLFNIQMMIRQSVRYALARHVLSMAIYLPLASLIYSLHKHRGESLPHVLLSNTSFLFLIVAAVVALKYRSRVLNRLDQVFFREAYNSEKILLEMIESVKNMGSISELSRWVSAQIETALHPRGVLVLFRNRTKGELSVGYSSGEQSRIIRIPDSSEFLRIAEEEARPHELSLYQKRHVPTEESALLEDLGIHLVVPMNGPDQRLVGLLLLGEKKSEEPYTAGDRKLLDALGSQIALLCENLLLKEKVDQEIKVREEVLVHLTEQKKNVMKECPVCGRCYDQETTKCTVDFSELVLSLPVERLIDGKYRLDRKIGRGGMGAVYRATDVKLIREVAVKIMIGSMFGDRAALRRFEREARTSASLKHPNVVTVFDFGQLEGQGAYLVMEFVEGQTMRLLFQTEPRIPRSTLGVLFPQILEGIKAAHEIGIIHRDLKPENILISRNSVDQPHVKILDFGLAKVQQPEGQSSFSLTGPGSVLGTISYMSPEQITGGEVDARSDIFSIGVLLAEALTGEPPFQGETSSDIALAILQKPFHFYEDPAIDQVLQKCLAKKPSNRYSTVAELQQKLLPLIASATLR